MSKNKDKTTHKPVEIIHKSAKGFRFRLILVVILWALFFGSVAAKLIFSKGITSLLVLYIGKIEISHWSFFNPNALLEVAKTIGVFSVLIVWIYAELGKSELGIRYTELLSVFCKHYHLRALSYILAILACIYISSIGILESAGIAMVIALLGLWDQMRVLVHFIFNPAVRKELAVNNWNELFNVQYANAKPHPNELLTNLYILIDNLSVNDNYFDSLCKCLARGILKYTRNDKGNLDFSKEKIISVSNFWERMLDGRPHHEQYLILHNVLMEISISLDSTDVENEKNQIVICAGYLQRQIRYFTKSARPAIDNEIDILISILSDIHHVRNKLPVSNGNRIAISVCLDTLYASLCWMHFLCNNIPFDQELLNFLSYYRPIYSDLYKEYYRTFILCTFDETTCTNNFDIVWNQIRKP